MQKRASQVLIYQKTCKNVQKCAKSCKNVQKRASQIFLDPIQKRAPARSVQLEAVYLEALLYFKILKDRFFFSVLAVTLELVSLHRN